MKRNTHLFTSESVSMGHPDKVADQISDAVVDAIMAQDPMGRVACETLVTTGLCLLAGEITTECYVDIPEIARETIKEIGYTDAKMGFDWESVAVLTSIHSQSPDIAMGVDAGENKDLGAGDQGIMFGYACTETPQLMPMPIMLAHQLVAKLADLRRSGTLPYLRPDGKSQVTVEYENEKPVRVHTVVIAAQHSEDVSEEQVRTDLMEKLIVPTVGADMIDDDTVFHINATGRFVMGGPMADTGLTGRKVIADAYGGRGNHGGGAFSGKDPTKVDRSASYAARHAAKNVVAAGLADACEVQLSYAIGVSYPLSVSVDTEGTARIKEDRIAEIIRETFDFRPAAMIERLDLRRPIYKDTARDGHFGWEKPDYTWEQLDMVDEIRKRAGM